VVGYKYVRLYAENQTPHLYAGTPRSGGGVASRYKAGVNMSQIGDVCEASAKDFPNLALAEFSEIVLGPGDTLYMPAGTWHYVRSLSPSMSVNFWF
jgi:lysine-specific demethylase 8